MENNEKIIHVAEEEGEKIYDLPLESDGSLSYATLIKYFPEAKGLRYYTEIDTIRGVKLSQTKFFPPHVNWGSTVYYCVFLQELEDESMSTCRTQSPHDVYIDSEHLLPLEVKMEEIEAPEPADGSMNANTSDRIPRDFFNANNSNEILNQDNETDSQSSRLKKFAKLRKQTNKRPHRCDICGNCFTQQSHMQRHRRIHTGEKPFSCEACGEKFSRSDKLKLHTYKCHAIAELVNANNSGDPDVREKREKRPKILDDSYEWGTLPPVQHTKHLTVKFKKSAPVDNDATNGDYYSVVSMAEVKMGDSDDQKCYSCQFCPKIFSKKTQFQRHARTHTGERPFSCQVCHKSFTRIDALKRHTASAGHKKQTGQNPDNLDPDSSKPDSNLDQQELTLDMESNHSEEMDPLDVKNEMENSNGNLDESFHQKMEFGEIEPEIDYDDDETSCDVASFAQVTYASLESTKPEDTKRGKENFCHICQHTFTNKFNYNRHMKSHDKISKSFRCQYCHYMFRRQSHLTRHVLIHTGEKPFHCTYCSEKFSRSDKLKLHISRVHSEGEQEAVGHLIQVVQAVLDDQSEQSIQAKQSTQAKEIADTNQIIQPEQTVQPEQSMLIKQEGQQS